MSHKSSRIGSWEWVLGRLSRVADIDATARQFKAFERRGKVADPVSLLRLALMYGPGGLSLQGTATAACGVIADLSDKAVEGRLRKCGDWLEHLLECLLRDQASRCPNGALALSLVDGSVISAPGDGGKWRLHADYDPGVGQFRDLSLTPIEQGETVDRTRLAEGRVLVTDRGYARVRDFKKILSAGSDFITRLGWRSLALQTETGAAFDIIAALPEGDAAVEHRVRVSGVAQTLRLVVQRLPAQAAASNHKRVARRSSRSGHRIDPRTTQAAGYMMLLTSLSAAAQSGDKVLRLYRTRWQVELGFKRLKTLGGIDALPTADPRLARTWMLSHLIVAVLSDELANQIVAFPPSPPSHSGRAGLAVAELAEGPPTRHQ